MAPIDSTTEDQFRKNLFGALTIALDDICCSETDSVRDSIMAKSSKVCSGMTIIRRALSSNQNTDFKLAARVSKRQIYSSEYKVSITYCLAYLFSPKRGSRRVSFGD